jgi:hypothetical protein
MVQQIEKLHGQDALYRPCDFSKCIFLAICLLVAGMKSAAEDSEIHFCASNEGSAWTKASVRSSSQLGLTGAFLFLNDKNCRFRNCQSGTMYCMPQN